MPSTARAAGRAALVLAAAVASYRLIKSGLRPESQLFGASLISGDDPDEWALTYDDGPNPRSTPELLDVLARHQVRATFFMMGEFVRGQRELVRRVQAEGHLVGNHTMTHPFLATKSMRFVRREIRDCNALLEDTLGAPVRYFRAPYGGRRPAILRFVREEGLVPVQWNAQGNDWQPIGAQAIADHMQEGIGRARRQGRGANLLLHDGFNEQQGYDRTATVHATDLLLQQAAAEGRRMVTVAAWG